MLGQDVDTPPIITIANYQLEVVHEFTYLGSTITDNLSLDAELNKRIGKAATTLWRLATRVWENPKLTTKTKMAVYNACVVSTLLYGSEAWTIYSKQERKLNSFHLRSLRRILCISWRNKVPNTEVLDRAGLPTMYTLLRQRRMRWIGHVRRMEDGRIPKDILYGELAVGKRPRGRPQLRYKDTCKRDMKALEIDPESWEDIAADRSSWRCLLQKQLKEGGEKITNKATEKRTRRNEKTTTDSAASTYICCSCSKDFLSRIGLISHRWYCLERSTTN